MNNLRERSASEQYAAFCPPIVTRGEEQDAASHAASPSPTAADREWQEWSRPTNVPNEGSTAYFHLYSPPEPWGLRLKRDDPSNDPAYSRQGLVVDRVKQNCWVRSMQERNEKHNEKMSRIKEAIGIRPRYL